MPSERDEEKHSVKDEVEHFVKEEEEKWQKTKKLQTTIMRDWRGICLFSYTYKLCARGVVYTVQLRYSLFYSLMQLSMLDKCI